jgi:hypothetical protein
MNTQDVNDSEYEKLISNTISYMCAYDLLYLKEPISKNRLDGDMCKTCGKIFYGYRYKRRLQQHCDDLSHQLNQ